MNLKANIQEGIRFIREVIKKWQHDGAAYFAAALTFYSIFSIGPLLLIAISIAGLFWEQQTAQEEVLQTLSEVLGAGATPWLTSLLNQAGEFEGNRLIAFVSVPLLAYSALNIFHHLHLTLNRVWGVKSKSATSFFDGLRQIALQRLRAFIMVLVVGSLIFLALVLSASVSVLNNYLGQLIHIQGTTVRVLHFFIAWFVFTLLIGTVFKILPDAKIRWRVVWLGAALTSLVFTLAKDLISLLVSTMGVASAYGAAGSAIVFLFWVYASAQIFFLGAEFTQVYTQRYGEDIVPAEGTWRKMRKSP